MEYCIRKPPELRVNPQTHCSLGSRIQICARDLWAQSASRRPGLGRCYRVSLLSGSLIMQSRYISRDFSAAKTLPTIAPLKAGLHLSVRRTDCSSNPHKHCTLAPHIVNKLQANKQLVCASQSDCQWEFHDVHFTPCIQDFSSLCYKTWGSPFCAHTPAPEVSPAVALTLLSTLSFDTQSNRFALWFTGINQGTEHCVNVQSKHWTVCQCPIRTQNTASMSNKDTEHCIDVQSGHRTLRKGPIRTQNTASRSNQDIEHSIKVQYRIQIQNIVTNSNHIQSLFKLLMDIHFYVGQKMIQIYFIVLKRRPLFAYQAKLKLLMSI